jgi:hypothetical protein
MRNFFKNFKTPLVTGIIFVLGGTFIWHLSTLSGTFSQSGMKLLEFISHGLICVGFVAVILEIPDWRKYFGDRVSDIVLKNSYLDTLNDEQLSLLQAQLLQSKFRNSEIAREGSFLEFLQTNLHHHVNSSYRENVQSNVDITEVNGGDLLCIEELSYVIKTMGDDSIKDIEWTWVANEIKEDRLFRVITKCPPNKFRSNNCHCPKQNNCIDGSLELTSEKQTFENNDIGYKINLDTHLEVTNGILVKVKLEYLMGKNRLYFWSMIVPSKMINLNVRFPEHYKIDSFIGGLYKFDYIEEKTTHSYSFTRNGWMLPRAGIALNFYKTENN